MKKILALILAAAALVLCLAACSKENQEGEESETTLIGAKENVVTTTAGTFEYAVNEQGEYEISDYDPATVAIIDIELPKTTPDGRDITGIGENAFKAENSIQSVKIPETYTHIGKYAFYDCDALTTVTMTDNVISVAEGAFQACDKLATVTFSKSVATISPRTFMNCKALTAIDLSGNATIISDGAFYGCSELTAVTLSDKITSVEKTAFMECPKLAFALEGNGKYLGNATNPHLVLVTVENLNVKDCTVNANTKVIANAAMANCPYLEKVTLGAGVVYVDAGCFENSPFIEYTEYENARYLGTAENPHMVLLSVIIPSCDKLTLHAEVKVITESAFSNCHDLTNLNYPKTTTDWNTVIKAEGWAGEKTIDVYCAGDEAAKEPTA